jgi:hypothetical protein
MQGNYGILLVAIVSFMLVSTAFPNVAHEETMTVPLYAIGSEERAYATDVFYVPLFIKNVRVDVSVKMNTYLLIWVELKVGPQTLTFTLNDMSVGYHLEKDRIQVDGKISEQAMSLKATINTDGIIEGHPRIILTFYSL